MAMAGRDNGGNQPQQNGGRGDNDDIADDISNQTRAIAETFYDEELEADNLNFKKIRVSSVDGPPRDENLKKIGRMLKGWADNLQNDAEYRRASDKLKLEDPEASYIGVMRHLFEDGIYNWGRVAMLFAFGYDLFKKAFDAGYVGIMNGLSLLKRLIGLLVDYVSQNLSRWIVSVGGWANIFQAAPAAVRQLASASSSTHQMTLAVCASAVVATLSVYAFYKFR